jgi:histidinol-phosphatase (PHP family)
MNLVDMHVHSIFSFDGKDSLLQECEAALEKELCGICFTEHFSADKFDVSYGVLDYTNYRKQVSCCQKKYAGRLSICCGLEIGEPHLVKCQKVLKKALQNMQLDFIIGSIHNIGSKKIRLFMQGKTKEEIYRAYFNEVLLMVQTADIDVIGHLDLAKRYAFSKVGDYSFPQYKEQIKKILRCAIDRNIGIEVNTSGWRNAVKKPYPSFEVLSLYRQLGGKYITLGSDAHNAKDIGADFIKTEKLLRKSGFKESYKYYARKAQILPFVL